MHRPLSKVGDAVPLWVARGFIIALVALTFWPVIRADFGGWDDRMNVSENPRLLPPTTGALRHYWTSTQADLFIPVTYTVWWLLAQVAYNPPGFASPAGLNPAVFHMGNLVCHAIASLVVFEVLRRCVGRTFASALGALLFALHPVQVESVAWVAGMKDVLAGMFALIALWQYLVASDCSTLGRRALHWSIATLAFMLGMLSKPSVVVVPLLAGIVDRLILDRPMPVVARRVIPWLLLAVPCVIWTRLAQPAQSVSDAIALWYRPLIATDALAFYVRQILWPVSLGVDYSRTPQFAIARAWIYWTWIVPAIVTALLWLTRRRTPIAAASWIVFIAALLPVLGLVSFDFQAYSTVADHYLYLAMLGPALLLAGIVAPGNPKTVGVGVVLMLLALPMLTRLQLRHWQDGVTIFSQSVRVNPSSWVSHQLLSFEYTQRQQRDEALQHARAAVALKPEATIAQFTLAVALANAGLESDAISEYRKLIERDPNHVVGRLHLAELLVRAGDPESAVEQYRAILTIDPSNATARQTLSRLEAPTSR